MRAVIEWFVRPASPRPLALFRVAVGTFCVIKALVVYGYSLELFGQYGWVQWTISKTTQLPGLPHMGDLANLLSRFGIEADQTVWGVLWGFIIASLFLAAGMWTRAAAIVSWAMHFLLLQAGGGLVYGMDTFTHLAIFYCLIMPCGQELSIDALRIKGPAEATIAAGVTRRMLQVHLCLIYFSAGFEKARGEQWWNGEAVWRSLMMPTFRQFDFGWLAEHPWIPLVAGWATLATETLYPIFIWPLKTRRIWLWATILMHAVIALCLGLWMFSGIMLVLNLGAFGFGSFRAESRRRES